MKRILSLSAVILFIIILSGCVRYYKASDVKKNLKKGLSQATRIENKVKKDYSTKKKVYDTIIPYVEQKDKQPYPLLIRHLTDMESAIGRIKNARSALFKTMTLVTMMMHGKKKIQSDRPEWDKLQKLINEYEDNVKLFQKETKSYETASAAFIKTAKKNRISKVDTSQVKKKIGKYNIRVKKTIKDAGKTINRADQKLSDAGSRGYDPKVIDEKKKLLEQMKDILKQIKVKNGEIAEMAGNFEKEAGNRKQIWVGPGMVAHTVLSDMQKAGNVISALGKRFNGLSQKLKSDPQKKKKK